MQDFVNPQCEKIDKNIKQKCVEKVNNKFGANSNNHEYHIKKS